MMTLSTISRGNTQLGKHYCLTDNKMLHARLRGCSGELFKLAYLLIGFSKNKNTFEKLHFEAFEEDLLNNFYFLKIK